MAQFRATITNGRENIVSRLGHKTTGLRISIGGWNLRMSASISFDKNQGEDILYIYIENDNGQANMHIKESDIPKEIIAKSQMP